MYSNAYLDLGEVQIGLYGNSRYSTLNLITANNEIFEEYFQNTNTDINYKKKQFVKGFVAADRQIDLNLNVVYEKLGLYQNSQPIIPVFKRKDLSTRDQYIDTKNPPASSAVEVRKLINDNLLIEIEAIAVAN
ncbi:RidA family protein [Bacillus toyonensis]|uniref:RidA family protein n=1 Tax=Bacillus toyonensis TaxID=155322 RepID=UPI0038FD2EF0